MDDNEITIKEKRELEKKLHEFKSVKRIEVIEELKIARSYGDLSENAEYHTARRKQGEIEGKILEIENILKNHKIIHGKHQVEEVCIGSTVEVEVDGEIKTYLINLKEGNGIPVSSQSPVAKALIEKKIGDIVSVDLPNKKISIKIKKIT